MTNLLIDSIRYMWKYWWRQWWDKHSRLSSLYIHICIQRNKKI